MQVAFDDDLADDIHAALSSRRSCRARSSTTPDTSVARSVRLRRIERGEQLVLGLDAEEFWRVRTFEELARLQGAGQPVDPDVLYDAEATDEERDAFVAAIAELE